jgi:DNA-binding CsgD family transcriptional regulator
MNAGTLILRNEPNCLPVRGFWLDDGTFVCGRSGGCDLFVDHTTVSRRHAQLRVSGLQVEVVDLDSRNGTFIDGAQVDRGSVRPGSSLALGQVSFVLLDARDVDDDFRGSCETVTTRDIRSLPRADSPLACLSAAQRRVVDLLLEGLSEKQIAKRLEISRFTVHNHIRNIYSALDVHSRGELMAKLIHRDGA